MGFSAEEWELLQKRLRIKLPPLRQLDPVEGIEAEEERLRMDELRELYKETEDEEIHDTLVRGGSSEQG
jgi:hypothetical protein